MVEHKRFDVEMEEGITIVRLRDPKLHEMILITQLHDELLEYIEHHRPRKTAGRFCPGHAMHFRGYQQPSADAETAHALWRSSATL